MRIFLIIFIACFVSCSGEIRQQPRPHQYPRIDFPEKNYQVYRNSECPFSIEIPVYAEVVQKERLFDEVIANPCWFDVLLSGLNATIHCSYYAIGDEYNFDKLVNDAFKMASKHNVKASFREEFSIENGFGAAGMIFKINGPVATPYQFYMTDSTNHFLRGSLYFNEQVAPDSIAPVISFIEQDIQYLLESLRWQ